MTELKSDEGEREKKGRERGIRCLLKEAMTLDLCETMSRQLACEKVESDKFVEGAR